MQFNGKTVCVCDCEGSMPLAAGQIAKACDGEATDVATHLCRAQLGRFEETLKAIDGDVVVACTKCIDACPAGAISPAGEEVAYDANICAGCGNCAGVCPTGAASYLLPSVDHLLTRLRTLGATYRDAGGTGPRLLVHDGDFGEDLISALARFGDGLLASVIPFAVNSVAQTGLEFLLSAVAYGYSRISVLVPPEKLDELDSVNSNVDLANTILAGLGYEHTRLDVISERDPSTVGSQLADGADVGTIEAATYLSTGGKRSLISLALGHLHGQAPAPVDVLALTDGAPFGTVGIEGSLESMTTGLVDENWAIEHHDLWAEQVMNEQAGETGEETDAKAQPAE